MENDEEGNGESAVGAREGDERHGNGDEVCDSDDKADKDDRDHARDAPASPCVAAHARPVAFSERKSVPGAATRCHRYQGVIQ